MSNYKDSRPLFAAFLPTPFCFVAGYIFVALLDIHVQRRYPPSTRANHARLSICANRLVGPTEQFPLSVTPNEQADVVKIEAARRDDTFYDRSISTNIERLQNFGRTRASCSDLA